MEAVRGAECYSFDRRFTEMAPVHNTIIPFTRNAVGPMDYTPVVLDDNVYPHLTTFAHELALAVVFESAILHFGDGPEAYRRLPAEAKGFLKAVPTAWDDTRCLAGAPGKHVVIARRKGAEWYVGGISSEAEPRTIAVSLSFLPEGTFELTRIEDGPGGRRLESRKEPVARRSSLELRLLPRGGAALRIVPKRP
jgi:hypothetical protein